MKKAAMQKIIRDLENQNLILMFERDIAERALTSAEKALVYKEGELDKAYKKVGELVVSNE